MTDDPTLAAIMRRATPTGGSAGRTGPAPVPDRRNDHGAEGDAVLVAQRERVRRERGLDP